MPKVPSNKTPDLSNGDLIMFVDDLIEVLPDVLGVPGERSEELEAIRKILELRIPKRPIAGRCPKCKELLDPEDTRVAYYCSCCQQFIHHHAKQQKPKAKQKKLR